MFTQKQCLKDQKVLKLLKMNELKHLVAYTSRGELTLVIRLGQTSKDYRFHLDSIPFGDKENEELKQIFLM